MKKFKDLVIVASCLGLLSACGDNQNADDDTVRPSSLNQLELKLNSIDPMSGQHYEGWAITSEGVRSTGRFNVNSQGEIFQVDASGNQQDIVGQDGVATFGFDHSGITVSKFVLTIEPDGDTDDGPSSVHYVEGDFFNRRAIATIQNSEAIGASFLNSSGEYILATPSNNSSTNNQGVWFLNAGAPSLDLPVLNTGFTYEGWVVNNSTGEVVSTGTFDRANQADSDGPGATAGPNTTPSFPGQDFINPPKVLNSGNYSTVITVEPRPDFDPAPFTLKILAHEIGLNAADEVPFALNNISNENEISVEATLN